MKFKDYLAEDWLNEKISPDQPLSRNQVRMALMKFHISHSKALDVARKITNDQLKSVQALSVFFKDHGLELEQTQQLVRYLWKLNEGLDPDEA